jgi:hypothetical protein
VPLLAAQPANWKKWLVKAGVEVGGAIASYLLTSLDYQGETAHDAVQWRHVQLVTRRTAPSGLQEDVAVYGIDLLNLTGGDIDVTWTTGDYTTVQAAFDTYLTAIKPWRSGQALYDQLRIYGRAFNPAMDPKKPFLDSGPPQYISDPADVAGTGTGVLPYQVAMSVTERTALPGHWGRMYLPNLPANALDSVGRWTSTATSAVATYVGNLYATLQAAGFYPVVPVTQVNKSPAHGLLSVNQLSVDDIPDVIRSRRAKMVNARAIWP